MDISSIPTAHRRQVSGFDALTIELTLEQAIQYAEDEGISLAEFLRMKNPDALSMVVVRTPEF